MTPAKRQLAWATADRPWAVFGMRGGLLAVGTVVMGVGIALLVWSRLGLAPLDVVHISVATVFGWSFGGGIIAVQAVLLTTFLPLRIKPGIGTVAAVLIPAVTVDVLEPGLPVNPAAPLRWVALVAGGVLFCLGVATYLTAELGPTPRDGVMVAARRAAGASARRVAGIRVGVDICFVIAGALLLGPRAAIDTGAVGPGTVLLAAGCGPLIATFWRLGARVSGISTKTGGELRRDCAQERPR